MQEPCPEGFSGNNCEFYECFGVSYDESSVCSGNGKCNSFDNCICDSGYSGETCDQYECFGVSSNDSSVCNRKGSCSKPDSCECNSGYYGNNCEWFKCFNHVFNSTDACSGFGKCVSPDSCNCNTGYNGNACETYECFGYQNTDSASVCSGSGICSSVDTCSCKDFTENSTLTTSSNVIVEENSGIILTSANGQYFLSFGYEFLRVEHVSGRIVSEWRTALINQSLEISTQGVMTIYGNRTFGSNRASFTLNDNSKCSIFDHPFRLQLVDDGSLVLYSVSAVKCFESSGESINITQYYDGTQCNIPVCFSKLSNDSNVCSGIGECVSPNNCKCQKGYYGNECQYHKCSEVIFSDASVCSGKGKCAQPEICECENGYYGANCENHNCYGKLFNDTNACSSYGSCSAPDNCNCTKGYYGNECENYDCNAISKNESNVCSGMGSCVGPNSCKCENGYYGSDCELFDCYGALYTSNEVCGRQGTCISPNKCNCTEGYTGDQCLSFTCQGLPNTDSSVCSRRGICSAIDTCTCIDASENNTFISSLEDSIALSVNSSIVSNNGKYRALVFNNSLIIENTLTGSIIWEFKSNGSDLLTISDLGILSLGDSVLNQECSNSQIGHPYRIVLQNDGKLITFGPVGDICFATNADENTKLTIQYGGEICDTPMCYGIEFNDSKVCSGSGSCVSPDTCVCYDSYYGDECGMFYCNGLSNLQASVCSGSGNCSSPNKCTCKEGYMGTDCEIYQCFKVVYKEKSVCSSHGICNAPDKCECHGNYYSEDCSQYDCNGIPMNVGKVCSSHGTCTSPNQCACEAGYYGNDCQHFDCGGIEKSMTDVCGSHGKCVSPDSCQCEPGYYGDSCQLYYCGGIANNETSVCSGNGFCVSQDECSCNRLSASNNYILGDSISVFESSSVLISSNGKFQLNITDNSTSIVDSDGTIIYSWESASIYVGEKGVLVIGEFQTGECKNWRVSSYYKLVLDDLGTLILFNSRGDICYQSSNETYFSQLFGGVTCEIPVCNGVLSNSSLVCSSHGMCSSPNNCSCEEGYFGEYCENYNCNGTLMSDISVCSSRGSCISPNNCYCESGYGGFDCSIYSCFNISSDDTNVCSTNGKCISNNNCSCLAGYSGETCESYSCYGKLPSSNESCSGNGDCFGPNDCKCKSGYYGDECEKFDCYGVESKNDLACSGFGQCISPNICACKDLYEGKSCNNYRCNGVLNSDPNVCGGRGLCTDVDTCVCLDLSADNSISTNDTIIFLESQTLMSGNEMYLLSIGSNIVTIENTKTGVISKKWEFLFNNVSIEISNRGIVTFNGILEKDNITSNVNIVPDFQPVCGPFTAPFRMVLQNDGSLVVYNIMGSVCFTSSELNSTRSDNSLQYVGSNCNIPKCYNYAADDVRVCSTNGNCSSPGRCECLSGYYGNECSFHDCFTLQSTNDTVCSGHGICTRPNSCVCAEGYYGDRCENYNCYNISVYKSPCSGVGSCLTPNNCSCPEGYYGDECEKYECFGISFDDSKVCSSGKGVCTAPNSCKCLNNEYGDECEKFDCFTVNSLDRSVCSGNGQCLSHNNCSCRNGYHGESCAVFTCSEVYNNDAKVCSGNGFCQSPNTCVCGAFSSSSSFVSGALNVAVDGNTTLLSNNGKFALFVESTFVKIKDVSTGAIITEWNVEAINVRVEISALGQLLFIGESTIDGSTVTSSPNRLATCSDSGISHPFTLVLGNDGVLALFNYAGKVCFQSGNSTFESIYTGLVCEKPKCFGLAVDDNLVCSGLGSCIAPDECSCNAGYYGKNCSQFDCYAISKDESSVCSSRGSCVSPNVCTCKFGYYGNSCEVYNCNSVPSNSTTVCSSHGKCMNIDTCDCTDNYRGVNCEIPRCNQTYADQKGVCSSHGSCIAIDTCKCNTGYYGNNCELFNCSSVRFDDSSVCSGHGNCYQPNKCECVLDYYGDNCKSFNCSSIPSTSSSVCSSHGACVLPDNCKCDNGYYGNECQFHNCSISLYNDISVCSGRGLCSSPNNCTCQTGYYGSICEQFDCYNIAKNNETVCSGRGSCSAPNNCTCKTGYYGSQCEMYKCYEVAKNSPSVCSGKGSCTSPDNCTCQTGYYGNKCESYDCFSVSSKSSSVCSGIGKCTQPNNCICPEKYLGDSCEINTCYGISMKNASVCSGMGSCSGIDTCTCYQGFKGAQCTIAPCTLDCQHGTCVNITITNAYCNCTDNYSGSLCEVKPCILNCGTNGECTKDSKGNQLCNCLNNFAGTYCQKCKSGFVLTDGKCVCDSSLGFVSDVASGGCVCSEGLTLKDGQCVAPLKKCDLNCGANGDCFFKANTTIGYCECRNKFITLDSTNPCTACPLGLVNVSNVCVCNSDLGYLPDNEGSCYCDTTQGYISKAGVCVCNSLLGFSKLTSGCSCATSAGYVNKFGTCVRTDPICKNGCGQGVCQYVDTTSSTTSCTCNTGYITTNTSQPCSSCISGYSMTNGKCKRVCPPEYYGDECNIYTLTPACISAPSTSVPFCKAYVKYSIKNTNFAIGATSATEAKTMIAANLLKLDVNTSSLYADVLKQVESRVLTCGDDCKASIKKLLCYQAFTPCNPSAQSIPEDKQWCSSVCSIILNNEIAYPDLFTTDCVTLPSSNCYYGNYLPPNTTCFGKEYSAIGVCSGKGSCVDQDTCSCKQGYSGSYCQYPICYGKDSSASDVCSSKGSCDSPNLCKCQNGYSGYDCSTPTCNSKTETEGGCSFRGQCVSPNTCNCLGNFAGTFCDKCKSGFTGPTCEIAICNGIASTDKSVCGGRGSCIAENGVPICKCNDGYDGSSCQNFKCDGIDRANSSVCSSKGKCISSGVCSCTGNYDHQKFCSVCTPAYTGEGCLERTCSEEFTCNSHGTCSADFKCICSGNWVGELCNTCKDGFVGENCQISCSSSVNCNSKGTCNKDGTCACQGNSIGASCESCLPGWYGDKCDYKVDESTFGFTEKGDSIVGTIFTPIKKRIKCSNVIANVESLGSNPVCIFNEKNVFQIVLGSMATINIGDSLKFRTYLETEEVVDVLINKKEYQSIAPAAVLTTDKTSISQACGSIYLDASGSVSLDRRKLLFSWTNIEAPTPDDDEKVDNLLASVTSSGVSITAEDLSVGSYLVQVTVKSSFSQEQTVKTVKFEVSEKTAPFITLKEGLVSSFTIGNKAVITPLISLPKCYSGVGPIIYEYQQDTTLSQATVEIKTQNELLVLGNDFTMITEEGDYYFALTVSQSGASNSTINFKIVAKALPLKVSFSVKDLSQSFENDVKFSIYKSDPSAPTSNDGVVSLTCMNIDTAELCDGFQSDDNNIDQTSLLFVKKMDTGLYLFTATFVKGLRKAQASLQITILDEPKSRLIRVQIQPPSGADLTSIDPSVDLILQTSVLDTLTNQRVFTWSSSDLEFDTSVVVSKKYIVIPKSLLAPGATYKVDVTIVDGKKKGSASIQFTVNSPPTLGEFEVSPTSGVALKDEFKIKCGNGWSDPQSPLSYEFQYKKQNDSTWNTLSQKSETKSISITLPAGELDIKVIVYDSMGAASETTQKVVVSLPDADGALSSMENQGSVSVSSMASVMSVVGSVSSNSPEQALKIQEAASNMVNKYFDQTSTEESLTEQSTESTNAKISVISSISGCVNTLNDDTVSKVVDNLDGTISGASSSDSVKMGADQVDSTKASAGVLENRVSSSLSQARTLMIRSFKSRKLTASDLSKLDNVFAKLVECEIKNVVSDMPAIRGEGVGSYSYARLVSVPTLSGLNEFVNDRSSFKINEVITSVPEISELENVKLFLKVSNPTSGYNLTAASKSFEFYIFDSTNSLNIVSNETLATLSIERIPQARKIIQSYKCMELNGNTYLESTDCTIVSNETSTFSVQVKRTGVYTIGLFSTVEEENIEQVTNTTEITNTTNISNNNTSTTNNTVSNNSTNPQDSTTHPQVSTSHPAVTTSTHPHPIASTIPVAVQSDDVAIGVSVALVVVVLIMTAGVVLAVAIRKKEEEKLAKLNSAHDDVKNIELVEQPAQEEPTSTQQEETIPESVQQPEMPSNEVPPEIETPTENVIASDAVEIEMEEPVSTQDVTPTIDGEGSADDNAEKQLEEKPKSDENSNEQSVSESMEHQDTVGDVTLDPTSENQV